MARKLYIFNPSGRVKIAGDVPAKWVGGFSSTYSYLGDFQARLLGVGHNPGTRRLPSWLHTAAVGASLKGGASRFDRDFRGWG